MSCSIAWIRHGVFFRRLTSSTLATKAIRVHLTVEQFAASLGHGMHVEPQKVRDLAIAAMAELLGFEAGIQPSLALIEKAEE